MILIITRKLFVQTYNNFIEQFILLLSQNTRTPHLCTSTHASKYKLNYKLLITNLHASKHKLNYKLSITNLSTYSQNCDIYRDLIFS